MRIDHKKIPRAELERIRIAAAKEMAGGASPTYVANKVGVAVRSALRWQAQYQQYGEDGLKATVAPGATPKLSDTQLLRLCTYLRMNPTQLCFEFALWTRAMVRELIQQKFAVTYTLPAVGDLLHRMGLSPQKPQYVATERDPVRVGHWLEHEYPQIAAQVRRDGAKLFFGDESGVRSDHHSGTTWAPLGQTPVLTHTGSRFGVNMLSAISTRGEVRFMITEERVNSEVFIEFLERLMLGEKEKVHLIVDGARIHFSKKVTARVAQWNGQLTIHCLPPYSPHLNPDEQVWAAVKHEVGRAAVTDRQTLKERIRASFQKLVDLPDRVIAMFKHPDCAYTLC